MECLAFQQWKLSIHVEQKRDDKHARAKDRGNKEFVYCCKHLFCLSHTKIVCVGASEGGERVVRNPSPIPYDHHVSPERVICQSTFRAGVSIGDKNDSGNHEVYLTEVIRVYTRMWTTRWCGEVDVDERPQDGLLLGYLNPWDNLLAINFELNHVSRVGRVEVSKVSVCEKSFW